MDPKYLPGTQLWVDLEGRKWPAVVMEYHEYEPQILRSMGTGDDICVSFYHNPQVAVPLNSHNGNLCIVLDFDSERARDSGSEFQKAMADARLDKPAAARRLHDAQVNPQRPWENSQVEDPYEGASAADFGDDVVVGGEMRLQQGDPAVIKELLEAVTDPETKAAIIAAMEADGIDVNLEPEPRRRKMKTAARAQHSKTTVPHAQLEPQSLPIQRGRRSRDPSEDGAIEGSRDQLLEDSATVEVVPPIALQLRNGWDEGSLSTIADVLFAPEHQLLDPYAEIPRKKKRGLVLEETRDGLPPVTRSASFSEGDYEKFPATLGPKWELVSVLGAASVTSKDADFEIVIPNRGEGIQQKDTDLVVKSEATETSYLLVPLSEDGEAIRSWMTPLEGETTLTLKVGVSPGGHNEKELENSTKQMQRKAKREGLSLDAIAPVVEREFGLAMRAMVDVPKTWHESLQTQQIPAPRSALVVDLSQRVEDALATAALHGKAPSANTLRINVRFVGTGRDTFISQHDPLIENQNGRVWDGTVVLVAAKERSADQIVSWVERNQERLKQGKPISSRGETSPHRREKKSGSLARGSPAGELESASRVTLTTKCCLSLAPLRVPCRGFTCQHDHQVVELRYWVQKCLESNLWRCPICSHAISLQRVLIDEGITRTLAKVRDRFPHDDDLSNITMLRCIGPYTVAVLNDGSLVSAEALDVVNALHQEQTGKTLEDTLAGEKADNSFMIELSDDDE